MRRASQIETHRRRPRLWAALAAGVTATALTLPAVGALAAGSAANDVQLSGTIDILGQDGKRIYPPLLGIDPELRLLATIPIAGQLYLIDLDTLRLVRAVPVPGYNGIGPALAQGTVPVGTGGAAGFALDPIHHVAYLGDSDADNALLRVWAVSMTGAFEPSVYELPPQSLGEGLSALGYSAEHDLLYMTTSFDQRGAIPGGTGTGGTRWGHPMSVHQIDAARLRAGDSDPLDWSYPIPACTGQSALTAKDAAPGYVSRSAHEDFVFFPCEGATEEDKTGAPGSSQAGIVRLNLAAGGPPEFRYEFYPFGVGLSGGLISGDAAHDLIYVVDTSKSKLWAFDALHRAWIGSVPYPASAVRGFAFGAESARVYFSTAERLFVSEGASLPLPQGTALTWPRGLELAHAGAMAFDPVRRRMLVVGPLGTHSGETVVDGSILVFDDKIPPAAPFQLPDPDAATQDLAEEPGRTVSTFSAHGTAFGARYLIAGGIRPLIANLTGGDLTQSLHIQFPLNQGTREVYLGRITEADLDVSTAGAAAVSTSVDTGTESDLAQLENPDPGQPVPESAAGAVRQAAEAFRGTALYAAAKDALDQRLVETRCQDLGEGRNDDAGFGTAVGCDLEGSAVSASAQSDPSMAESPVQVAYATSSVKIRRDPKLGSIVEATAEARGVDVLGQLHIGLIRQTVTVAAHGRPGTSLLDAATLLKQVQITDPSGGELYACGFGESSCDPFEVTAAINRYLSLRVQAEVPPRAAEPRLAKSPRGAQAALIKDPWRFWNDLNSNDDNSHEVAALQLTVYHDTIRPSREVIQLAAVEADAHYAIAPAAAGDGGGDDPGGGVVPPIDVLPTPTPLPSLSTPAPADPGPSEPVVRRVLRGARFLLQSPRDMALLAGVWGLLFAPAYLLIRRRQLSARALGFGGTGGMH